MKTRLQMLAITVLAASSALGGALASPSDPGIDLEAIRQRAADQSGEAEALAANARERAKGLDREAASNAEAAKINGRTYASQVSRATATDSTFDFDQMVTDAGDMAKEGMGKAPRFIAFASLSMPAQALRQMMDDVTRAGGVVVFRGLSKGSAKLMTDALTKVLKPGERMDGVGIDPRLFRAFAVNEVPAYVVTASDFDLCSGLECTTSVPPFDRMTGNVTAEYALRTFAAGGGPGAKIAAQHLTLIQEE